jgi:hypothetical protein
LPFIASLTLLLLLPYAGFLGWQVEWASLPGHRAKLKLAQDLASLLWTREHGAKSKAAGSKRTLRVERLDNRKAHRGAFLERRTRERCVQTGI